MDRFIVWVGSLYARSQSFSLNKDEGQTFIRRLPGEPPWVAAGTG